MNPNAQAVVVSQVRGAQQQVDRARQHLAQHAKAIGPAINEKLTLAVASLNEAIEMLVSEETVDALKAADENAAAERRAKALARRNPNRQDFAVNQQQNDIGGAP